MAAHGDAERDERAVMRTVTQPPSRNFMTTVTTRIVAVVRRPTPLMAKPPPPRRLRLPLLPPVDAHPELRQA